MLKKRNYNIQVISFSYYRVISNLIYNYTFNKKIIKPVFGYNTITLLFKLRIYQTNY